VGVAFGPDVAERFLRDNGLDLLIRRSPPRAAPRPAQKRQEACCTSGVAAQWACLYGVGRLGQRAGWRGWAAGLGPMGWGGTWEWRGFNPLQHPQSHLELGPLNGVRHRGLLLIASQTLSDSSHTDLPYPHYLSLSRSLRTRPPPPTQSCLQQYSPLPSPPNTRHFAIQSARVAAPPDWAGLGGGGGGRGGAATSARTRGTKWSTGERPSPSSQRPTTATRWATRALSSVSPAPYSSLSSHSFLPCRTLPSAPCSMLVLAAPSISPTSSKLPPQHRGAGGAGSSRRKAYGKEQMEATERCRGSAGGTWLRRDRSLAKVNGLRLSWWHGSLGGVRCGDGRREAAGDGEAPLEEMHGLQQINARGESYAPCSNAGAQLLA
jgi:hypothetical protein